MTKFEKNWTLWIGFSSIQIQNSEQTGQGFFFSELGTNQRDHFQSRWFWLICTNLYSDLYIFIYSYIFWLKYIYIFLYILTYRFPRSLVPIPSQICSDKIDVERYPRSNLNLLSNCESLSKVVQGRTKRFSSIFCKRQKNFC